MVQNVIQIKRGIKINASVSVKTQKSIMCVKHIYIWNPATCGGKNDIYEGRINDVSIITCDETTDATKTVPTKSTLIKSVPTKTTLTNFYILLAFLLITVALLLAVSNYCYQIKHRSKQKHLLPSHNTSNKFKKMILLI